MSLPDNEKESIGRPNREATEILDAFVSNVQVRRAAGIVAGVALLLVVFLAAVGPATLASPRSCASCHGSAGAYNDWRASSHSAVRCERCHLDRAYLAGEGNSIALASDAWRALGLQSARDAAWVPDSACTSCHPDGGHQTPLVIGSLRMSHAGLAEGGYRCIDCHAGVAHTVPVGRAASPSMSLCARCHNNEKVSGKCDVCHVQSLTADQARRSDPEWSKTHGPNWRQLHGMGVTSTCTMCHTTAYCERCHGVPVPHDQNFIVKHGAFAKKYGVKCFNCHTQSFCDSCHGLPMPHPTGFLPLHSKLAKATDDPACLKCHVADDCQGCHVQHIHPGGVKPVKP